ncbi:hypothetical protein DITRI_Ditri04bG0131600 [Diplodiscus trichospermus]
MGSMISAREGLMFMSGRYLQTALICLSVAAVIDKKILCMHAGLSLDLKKLDQILNIARPVDVPNQGLLCDLLWADLDKDFEG